MRRCARRRVELVINPSSEIPRPVTTSIYGLGTRDDGIVPSILPSLLGISLYRLDENIRSSLVLGFVGAGGTGFQLLAAMDLFQYREVSLLLIVIFVIVLAVERGSAALRARLA